MRETKKIKRMTPPPGMTDCGSKKGCAPRSNGAGETKSTHAMAWLTRLEEEDVEEPHHRCEECPTPLSIPRVLAERRRKP